MGKPNRAQSGQKSKPAQATPVMQQHASAKAAHPDSVVFFRLGDFYEMFGDDASVVARELGLTLTSRNKGKPDEIPMAGVPHHAAHGYIARLLSRGYKVAICEQMADPSTVKGIVPREVVRVITAGTWTSEDQLEEKKNSWLCSLHLGAAGVGLALLDLSTAELSAARLLDVAQALSELTRAEPREVLLSAEDQDELALDAIEAAVAEVLPLAQVRRRQAPSSEKVLRELAKVERLGLSPLAETSAASVLCYARECYKGKELPVLRVGHLADTATLSIDRAAVQHLELVSSSSDDDSASLLYVLDRTRTPGGARLLRRRLLAPLMDVETIRRRLEQVDVLVKNGQIRTGLERALGDVGDLERLAVRASQGEASPKDLGRIRRGLEAVATCLRHVSGLPDAESRGVFLGDEGVPPISEQLTGFGELLARALVDRPPASVKEGAVLAAGFDQELDRLAELRATGAQKMAEFEELLRRQTGISSLRVRFTRVFGWYVEVGKTHVSRVPDSFRRKQTVATGERYSLDELEDLAFEIQSAEEHFRTREKELLDELYQATTGASAEIHQLAAVISIVDCSCSLAGVAVDYDYARPTVDESQSLEVLDGRHPVVERRAALGQFVPNDVRLAVGEDQLWMISGPNMAGKSTFLRQVALQVILAQMGSFVPAKQAHIGVCDRVLSRVGASDNLAGGESTFMVEMRETANILSSATRRSLVIVDEIGRGTSTYDGLSIAWAIAEYLDQSIACRCLFATHYHELGELAERSPTVSNHCVTAKEHEGEVVFLHRVTAGVASRSYGVEVARLAGLPEPVLARAQGLLSTFEGAAERPKRGTSAATRQLDLFTVPTAAPGQAEAIATLRALDPERTTGLEALTILTQLRKLLDH